MRGRVATWWPKHLLVIKTIFLLFIGLLSVTGYGQDMRSHQWEERVLVILSDAENKDIAEKQLSWFKKYPEELNDRNMAEIYTCTLPECEYTGTKEFNAIMERAREGGSFIVLLIGLDGSIKYQSNQLEAPQVYFNLIDRMPMRRAQMRRRIKNGGNR